ncbi:MAG: hypothetical protein WAM97_18795, partial [Acidimicrobiales bacterium]
MLLPGATESWHFEAKAALRAVVRHLALILLLSLPAMAVFWHAWDGHLGSTATCACSDAGQEIWFMAWPAYALSHLSNPFFSSAVWSPNGVNLLSNASAPLIGITMAPLTWLFGPVVTTNVALTLTPGLNAWASWIGFRQFVRWRWAPWPASLLFGYSPFVMSNLRQGHLSIAFLVIPPLILAVLYEILWRQKWRYWVSGISLGALVAAQALISAEVLAMTALIVAIVLVFAALVAGPRWY